MMIHWYHHSLPAPRYYLHLEKLLHYFVFGLIKGKLNIPMNFYYQFRYT